MIASSDTARTAARQSLLLGCIADDFTGATDLSNNLVKGGMRVLQAFGVPNVALAVDAPYDAVVIALKSRTIPAAQAVAQSLQAQAWLTAQGAQQIYYKYCSTFDSSPAGNIGPVTEALMDALGCSFSVGTPAFPDNQRAVFKGHLFVGDVLLNESGMQHHPLTPMKDANLVRVLQAQSSRKIGLLDHGAVAAGPDAIKKRMTELQSQSIGMVIADAISNADISSLGASLKGHKLVAGGSGLAIGLPQNFGIKPSAGTSKLPTATGMRAILSGSCSVATNGQIRHFLAQGGSAFAVDPVRLAAGEDVGAEALAWAKMHLAAGSSDPVLIYSTAEPGAVAAVQQSQGASAAGDMIEKTLAQVARSLVAMGVGQLVVAGGETSGACVQALGIHQLQIGPQIAPGVPWCYFDRNDGHGNQSGRTGGLHLALKSGNFGSEDFFTHAFKLLAWQQAD
ncbi:MAG: hypothetical protein RL682_1628 [Pseudomonadota bacterium]|jgi:3-dehydrotetronate 4-kinase